MKKTLGVVAAATLAVMPMMGAMAANNIELKDQLTITVSDNCTFTRTDGTGSYSATMAPNELNAAVGSATYKVICNNSNGYKVNAVFEGLEGDQTTPSTIAYNAETPTAGSGTWTAALAGGNIAASAGTLMTNSGATAATGDTATVTYKVGTTTTQAKGSYTGSATYTFVQNS